MIVRIVHLSASGYLAFGCEHVHTGTVNAHRIEGHCAKVSVWHYVSMALLVWHADKSQTILLRQQMNQGVVQLHAWHVVFSLPLCVPASEHL